MKSTAYRAFCNIVAGDSMDNLNHYLGYVAGHCCIGLLVCLHIWGCVAGH